VGLGSIKQHKFLGWSKLTNAKAEKNPIAIIAVDLILNFLAKKNKSAIKLKAK
jgi:hypothetical protein